MKNYSEAETIERVREFIQEGHYEDLYKEDFVNRRGEAKYSTKKYIEIISQELLKLDVVKKLESIKPITRTSSYYTKSHVGDYIETNRKEEIFAKILLHAGDLECIGNVLDYQTPIKNKKVDNAGKIDLISYHKNSNTIFLIEIKMASNSETLLRCILEIATYYQLLDKGKFLKDFSSEYSDFLKDATTKNIKKAVLLEKGSSMAQHAEELSLKIFIKSLDISIFEIDNNPPFTVKQI